MPRAPAYSSPLASSRTDIDMSVVLGGDAEVVEQPAQRRVGAVVVDQESGVDADDVAVTAVQVMGVGVSADPAVGLEQGDPVAGRQHVRRRQPCDPAADDGDGAPAWLFSFHTGIRSGGRRGWAEIQCDARYAR